MNKYLPLLLIVTFISCKSNQEELITHKFIENTFLLEEKINIHGANYWQPALNRGIRAVDEYYDFFTDNEPVLRYLKWNLLDLKLPDSIKYSLKSNAEVHQDFQNFAIQDSDVRKAVNILAYPENYRDNNQIDVDSLVNLSARLFFASDLGNGKTGWSLCVGKSKFPEIYGEARSYKFIALQALCFQAVSVDQYSRKEQTVWKAFKNNISEVSEKLSHLESDIYVKKANQLMWKKMSESKELKHLIKEYVVQEKSKLYFRISGS